MNSFCDKDKFVNLRDKRVWTNMWGPLFSIYLQLYSIPTKPGENAYMVGSGPYMWNDCEQRKGKSAGIRDLWSMPTA